MNWKRSIQVCISLTLLLLPYNIIGCAGDEAAPYDYFISFFHKRMDGQAAYDPFTYTNIKFLYGDAEVVPTEQQTAAEWTSYEKQQFSKEDAYLLMCKFTGKEIAAIGDHIRKNNNTKLSDTIRSNGMARYIISQKDTLALKYIAFAKLAEPNVSIAYDQWEPISRDVKKMTQLINAGRIVWKQTSDPFLRLRYAYQCIRLAFYSGQNQLCLALFKEMQPEVNGTGVLRDLSLGIKAGALLRSGKKAEAAYEYSKLFGNTDIKKMSNYLSFYWTVKNMPAAIKAQALQLCKNNTERATLKGMLLMNSKRNELLALTDVYRTENNAPINALLLTREVQKLEEFYFTPALGFEKGEKKVNVGYSNVFASDPGIARWKKEAVDLMNFCRVNTKSNSTHKTLYALAGAHLAVILKNDTAANELLRAAEKLPMSQLQRDQYEISKLVFSIRSAKKIDAAMEEQLNRSIPWLKKKAGEDVEFARFYRRIFSDLLPHLYKRSGESAVFKNVLCLSVADSVNRKYIESRGEWGYYGGTVSNIREQLSVKQAEQLVQFMESKTLSPFEQFLVKESVFSKNDANDLAGTLHLRNYAFSEALKWLKKVPASYYKNWVYETYLAANPFADHLTDIHTKTEQDTVIYSKIQFAQRMIQLEESAARTTNDETKASLYYELAKGFYNITYWGNSWLLVQYGWSSTDLSPWYPGFNYKEKVKKDYYSAYRSRTYYEQALNHSSNKEFQAKCLFMIARCDQKRLGPIPTTYSNEKLPYMVRWKNWLKLVDQQNGVFSRLKKEYASTEFYRDVYNSCSYLQDFVDMK